VCITLSSISSIAVAQLADCVALRYYSYCHFSMRDVRLALSCKENRRQREIQFLFYPRSYCEYSNVFSGSWWLET